VCLVITRFIDPAAEIVFVPADDVLSYAKREGARSFDVPDAEFTHRGGRCTFEVLDAWDGHQLCLDQPNSAVDS
jgi:hypothetical protein